MSQPVWVNDDFFGGGGGGIIHFLLFSLPMSAKTENLFFCLLHIHTYIDACVCVRYVIFIYIYPIACVCVYTVRLTSLPGGGPPNFLCPFSWTML